MTLSCSVVVVVVVGFLFFFFSFLFSLLLVMQRYSFSLRGGGDDANVEWRTTRRGDWQRALNPSNAFKLCLWRQQTGSSLMPDIYT